MKEYKNIFELWKDNNERLPFKVRINSWSESHFAIVEKIEIIKWPYGKAFGQYFFYGKPGKNGLIENSGTYRWTLVE